MSPLSAEMRSRSETGFLVGVAKCSESYVKQSSFRRSSVRSGSMILGRIVGKPKITAHWPQHALCACQYISGSLESEDGGGHEAENEDDQG
jgi:hypothetical protein